ncbi:MAG: DNA-binding response regulator [Deltaproteobacteria bacterium]|nr:DNA-binding response regulator [Deltaproteobacteria bacterium]
MNPRASDPRHCGGPTVIVVDDEPSFRLSLADALRDDGHPVLDYPSATAVPPLDTLPPDAVLLTDFEMPGLNGIELADAFRRTHPRGHVILLSAYALDDPVAARPWLRFVAKPVDYSTLHQLMHTL